MYFFSKIFFLWSLWRYHNITKVQYQISLIDTSDKLCLYSCYSFFILIYDYHYKCYKWIEKNNWANPVIARVWSTVIIVKNINLPNFSRSHYSSFCFCVRVTREVRASNSLGFERCLNCATETIEKNLQIIGVNIYIFNPIAFQWWMYVDLLFGLLNFTESNQYKFLT